MENVTQGSLIPITKKTGPVDQRCLDHDMQMFRIPSGKIICEKCEEEKKMETLRQHSEAREVENKKRKVSDAHSKLNLPKRLQRYTFENYIADSDGKKKAVSACKSLLCQWPDVGGLLMVGGLGTGKTHLAVSICKALCDRAVTCNISTVSQIIRRIKASWNSKASDDWGPETEDDILTEYSQYGLLVIDEIGAQFGSDTERVMITEIINNRYEQERPTIAIGNVTKSEMETLIGARAVDRMLHKGFLVVFSWPSFRAGCQQGIPPHNERTHASR